jgi:TetR/AcrR family transcriptional regulator, transcriptional repressor for nem operon
MTGRPRQFEQEEALGKAMGVFWAKGYEATSVQDLLDAMGINRGSMYAAFGDKHSLFMKTLSHYREQMFSRMAATLDKPGSPLSNIEEVLRAIAQAACGAECKGCLVTNATVETAPHDPEVAASISESVSAIEKAFRRTLERAAKQGELKPGVDIRASARFLTGIINGLVVMGKARAGQGTLDDIVDVALSVLR